VSISEADVAKCLTSIEAIAKLNGLSNVAYVTCNCQAKRQDESYEQPLLDSIMLRVLHLLHV